MSAARAQEGRGWRIDLHTKPARQGRQTGDLSITFVDGAGDPIGGLEVRVELIRPTHGGIDDSLALQDRGSGEYGSAFTTPLPGQWDVRIFARRGGGEEFQATRRILIP